MFLALHCQTSGSKKILIREVGTDIVVLAVPNSYKHLLWTVTYAINSKRWYSIKDRKFPVTIYSKTCTQHQVNSARKELFGQESRTMENIPPTQAVLLQHVGRATYQVRYVWSQALHTYLNLLNGAGQLLKQFGNLRTNWSETFKASYELIHCVAKGCTDWCKCKTARLQCSDLCVCDGA